jgi:hypothetical protein
VQLVGAVRAYWQIFANFLLPRGVYDALILLFLIGRQFIEERLEQPLCGSGDFVSLASIVPLNNATREERISDVFIIYMDHAFYPPFAHLRRKISKTKKFF